jgi:hypothetical protein
MPDPITTTSALSGRIATSKPECLGRRSRTGGIDVVGELTCERRSDQAARRRAAHAWQHSLGVQGLGRAAAPISSGAMTWPHDETDRALRDSQRQVRYNLPTLRVSSSER